MDSNPTRYSSKRIFFLDLDGTVINTITGNTFGEGIWDMTFNYYLLDKLKPYLSKGRKYVFIATNQGGIQLGYLKNDSFKIKIDYIRKCLSDYFGNPDLIVDYSYCPYAGKSPLRKPDTGMLYGLINKYDLQLFPRSTMLLIGDASGKPGDFSDSDLQTAVNFDIDYCDVNDFIANEE